MEEGNLTNNLTELQIQTPNSKEGAKLTVGHLPETFSVTKGANAVAYS